MRPGWLDPEKERAAAQLRLGSVDNPAYERYEIAVWRGTLPPDPATGEMAIFFDTQHHQGDGIVRFRIPGVSAKQLAESILEYLV